MPGRKDEAVAVRPVGVGGVEFHEALIEGEGDRGEGHRRAGVARVGLLDRVHGQCADRIDAQLVQSGDFFAHAAILEEMAGSVSSGTDHRNLSLPASRLTPYFLI